MTLQNQTQPSVNELFKAIQANENLSQTIQKVFQGEIIGCEIKNFFNETHCDNLVKVVEKYEIDKTYLSGNASKILESQHNRQSDPNAYFKGVQTHPLLKESLFKYSVKRLLNTIQKSGFPTSVAFDADRSAFYCPSIIREFHSTLKLHNDLGCREGVGWNPIERVQKQWAFVVKLTQCDGGQTFVYDKKWEADDEQHFNHEDNYSYDMEVVKKSTEIKIEGLKGSLLLFDCTHYHRVDAVRLGKRYTMGGFIGLLEEEQRLIVWS